jgi:hypothetical protein
MSRVNATVHFEPVFLNNVERKQQTKMIMRLFEHWQLTYKQQAIALGLSPNTETSIHRYKNGRQCLPLYRDIQDRVGHLLAIHKYLRRAYPFNKNFVYHWITTPNSDFNLQIPFDIICKEGYMGLVKVRNYLEFSQLA